MDPNRSVGSQAFLSGLRSLRHQVKLEIKQDNLSKDLEHSAQAKHEAEGLEGADPGADIQRLLQSGEEMSAMLTQFRRRGDDDKKNGLLGDSFERVLDEDALPKSQQILSIAQTQGGLAELLLQARSLFPDESDLILVLRALLRRRQLDALTQKKLQAALLEVETQAEPRRLKAGMNCALKARLFGKALLLSPALLRACYRNFLESDAASVSIYEDWIASFGYRKREQVLDFCESSLLVDIDAQDPSCSHLEFGNRLGKLNQLKLLRSAEMVFVRSLLNNPLLCQHNDSEADWLLFMLMLVQFPSGIDALLLEVLGQPILLATHAQRATLLQTIRQACKLLPLALFSDETERPVLFEEFDRLADVSYHRELIEKRRAAEQW